MPDQEPYDRDFFDSQAARSLQSARVVLQRLFELIQPRRVLDVGCGLGTWLRAAQDLGAAEVVGLDGDYVDRTRLMIAPVDFIAADLAATPLRDALGRGAGGRAAAPFDLVICAEVAEHLPLARAESFIADLAGLGDLLLFSAAVPFQYGTQHVNEQWPDFWAILLRGQGFVCYDLLRQPLWGDTRVDWWYRQNLLVFARAGSRAEAALPAAARADARILAAVHPENLLANLLSLPRRHRQWAYDEELADLLAVTEATQRRQTVLPPLAAPARAAQAPADARNVFPWTRIDTWEPEQEVAALAGALAAAEHAREAALQRAAELDVVRAELQGTRAALADALRAHDRAAADLGRVHHLLQVTAAARLQAQMKLDEAARAGSAERDRQLAGRWRVAELEAKLAEEQQLTAALHREIPPLRAALDERAATIERLAREHAALQASFGWRLQRRLRRLRDRLPGRRRPPRQATPADAAPALPPPPLTPALTLADADAAAVVDAAPQDVLAAQGKLHPIKRYDTVFGEVSWWTLQTALTRLHRFELFDPEDYLRRNPDVAEAGIDAATHFTQSGALEDRGAVNAEEVARLMSGFMLFHHAVRALPPDPAEQDDLPALVADVPHIGIYVSSHGNTFMDEIAADLAADLRSVGVRVDVLDENAPIERRAPVCIYIAPHEFFQLGDGRRWVRDDVFFEGFMFNTEQVQTTWFQQSLPFIMMARGVFDLCAQTADLFARTDMAALHLLPGARRQPYALTPEDRDHALFRVLPPAAQATPDPARGFRDRPIDLSFFGTASPRRDQFFARNAAQFAEYETFTYCRRPGRGPIRGDSEDSLLTRLAGHVAGHSRITLNIHRDDLGYFEWHRMVRLGMCAGSVVVSDPCLPDPHFVAGEHYFQESTRRMPELLDWLLASDDGAREAERVRANVDDLMANVFGTGRSAARMLRFLARHRHRAEAA